MVERCSFMGIIAPRAHMVVDDYLNSLIVSGDLHLHDLTEFDFCLYENRNGEHFAARCRKKEKYSDVADVELLPLFDNDDFERMYELFKICVRDVLDIDVAEGL